MKLLSNNGVSTKMALIALGANTVNAIQQAPFKAASAFGDLKTKRNINAYMKRASNLNAALKLYNELIANGGTQEEIDDAYSVVEYYRR